MSDVPNLFIGSSGEAKEIADSLHLSLDGTAACQVWDQGIFEASTYTLESLVTEAQKFDFAVLVFSPDDSTTSRQRTQNSPRDNVVFELGLFVGILGRERTFVLCESSTNLKIPSDLAGVTRLTFTKSELGLEADLGPTKMRLKRLFEKYRKRSKATSNTIPSPAISEQQDVVNSRVAELGFGIIGVGSEPSLQSWYDRIVPQLRQSTYYTAPTYYLDVNLNIVGWNIAFELLFREIAHKVLYKHVSEFIARLANFDTVFSHGRTFSNELVNGQLPYADTEVLEYHSSRYGDVQVFKIATQLHGLEGDLAGWAVALLPISIDWKLFEIDVLQKIREDKLWSVYSTAYDRILLGFPPYRQLLADVTSAIGDDATKVLDIGAGTGNSTKSLLDRGFHVTSVEFSTGMLDRIRSKNLAPGRHTVVKARAESLAQLFPSGTVFDGATMVNSLYSCDDPFAVLCATSELLCQGGKLGLSTTHSSVSLTGLLDSIKAHLVTTERFAAESDSYDLLRKTNEEIERTIARRVSSKQYREMVSDAGFEIEHFEEFTYEGAVMLLHAKKR